MGNKIKSVAVMLAVLLGISLFFNGYFFHKYQNMSAKAPVNMKGIPYYSAHF